MQILNRDLLQEINYMYIFLSQSCTAFGDRIKPKLNCSDLLLPDLTGTTVKAGAVVRPIDPTRSR